MQSVSRAAGSICTDSERHAHTLRQANAHAHKPSGTARCDHRRLSLHVTRVALDGSCIRRKAPEIRKAAGHASVAAEGGHVLPGTRRVLRVTCYVLRVTCYVLRVTCCVLRVACYVLRAKCCITESSDTRATMRCEGGEGGGDAQEGAHVERQRSRVRVRPHAAELRTH
jgi:hypothetical protein